MSLTFSDVVTAWDNSSEADLHPLWNVSEDSFWECGWHQANQAAEGLAKNARILDFGAGNGRIAIPLARMGFEVIAADSSAKMLDRLKQRAKAEKATLTTVKTDGTDLAKALNRKKVDLAMARAVLIHHDHEGVEKIVKALASVTKSGGKVLVDWPVGAPQVRETHTQVTVWTPEHRIKVATAAGLKFDKELDPANGPTLFTKV